MAENILLMMTLTKITVARVNRKALSKLLAEIKDCSLNEKYETKEEKLAFLNYTKLPLYFIIIIASSMTIVEILYYLSGLTYGIQSAKENDSMGYQLPYRTLHIADLSDTRIYALICAYQTIIIPSVLFGYVGFDCMFVNLSVQVIAQFAVLSYKVKALLNNSENYYEGMKEIVRRHYQLIRLTEALENNFNYLILQQLLGTTVHICICGYHLLMVQIQKNISFSSFYLFKDTKEMADNMTLILFFLYVSCVITTLFIYCFIGECFIQESTKFGNAIYNYEWYDLPAIESKFFLICMARTKKPQYLTSGKFAVLSLTIFTDVSVLRIIFFNFK
ncbi:odorant receptor 4-like [Vespula maculifrons]|uniref:Odorant receptor 4-like n=1 Tax=Vespula maculifrons TaxID=7453 RepID=A0ABD2BPJ9_VESMC